MNWIIPRNIMAFSSPTMKLGDGLPPEFFIDIFRKKKVTAVVRLNEQLYDDTIFKINNIKVINLEFVDGSCPSDEIIAAFIQVCD